MRKMMAVLPFVFVLVLMVGCAKPPQDAINAAMSALDAAKPVASEYAASSLQGAEDAKAALASLGIEGKALVVVDLNDSNAIRSFMNLPEVQLIEVAELNAYDVLCADYVVFSKATLPTGSNKEAN